MQKATSAFEAAGSAKGKRLLAAMKEAAAEDKGTCMVELFKVLRASVFGHDGRGGAKLMAMYKDDVPRAETVNDPAELLEEVRKCGRRINSTKEVDIDTCREVMNFIRESKAERHVNVAEELCTWPACKRAIAGFKKGKGLGVDGFDGYLVRLLPETMQRQYHRILQGVVREGAYPRAWNEWIAMLAPLAE